MRRSLLFIVALAVAAPLPASWWPSWSPESVQLMAGQTTTVKVQAKWSGLVDYGGGIHWVFRSDAEHVATALVHVNDPQVHDVPIVAIAPGTAFIRQESNTGHLVEPAWVRIDVVCGAEAPVRPATAVLRARLGEPVAIAVVSEIAYRTRFTWYLGREGDRAHPLPAGGPEVAFTPDAYGTFYVWVSAITPCSASSAEFRIDVPRPRWRAVQRGR